MWMYGALMAAVAIGRGFELLLSKSRIRALAKDSVPFDRPGNWPAMVTLHIALLVLPLTEFLMVGEAPNPWLFWPCLVALVGTTGVRLWTQHELGPAWNARGIVDGDLGFRSTGPYRYLRHPNYLAVLIEVIALPLAGSAFFSLALLTPLHVAVLLRRIGAENEAMEALPGYSEAFAGRGGLFPKLKSSKANHAVSQPGNPHA